MTAVDGERAERRQAVHDFKRRAILAAARTVLSRKGPAGLTIRAVAAEAGYATGAVYSYFASKEEILASLVTDELGHLARRMKDADAPLATASAAQRLAAMSETAFHALSRDADILPLAQGAFEGGDLPPEVERLLTGRLIGALSALAAPIEPEGGTSEESASLTLAMAAFLLGAAMLERAGRFQSLNLDSNAVVRLGIERLARGT